MAYKSIFVPFFDETSARIGFEAGVQIARCFDGHISALHMRQRPTAPRVVYFPLGGKFPEGDHDIYKKAEDENAVALHQLFGDLSDANGIGVSDISAHTDTMGATASWRDEKGDIPERVATIAAGFDLTAMATLDDADDGFQLRLCEELLFQSGRPVLLCPADAMKKMPERVVVAWNGGAEAARTVYAGLPFLTEAKMVKLLTLHEPGRETATTKDIAASLGLHGIETRETEIELESGQDVNDVLVKEIGEAEPDLLIMGAYAHSRWRQTVFGGFTRCMLRHPAAPVLMMR